MLKGVNPGRMDMLVTIQQKSYTLNSIGEQIETWTTLKTCYAERVRKPGGENIQASQTVGTMPTEYKIRHDSTIDFTMRLCEGAQSGTSVWYYVRDVQHWKREGYTLIQAERRDNA
jgi:SPP1 family predicted phage head-tail adaptor